MTTKVFHEWYDEVLVEQLALYRKMNVSPFDHEMLRHQFGQDDQAIMNYVRKHSSTGQYQPPWPVFSDV